MEFKPKVTIQDNRKSKLKTSEEIRIEPPVPVEPIIKSNIEMKQEKAVKIDSGNTISKDALKKEDEELEKRQELEILEKLKSHENEEKKILAESKQILEELKARQTQLEKTKRKPVKYLKELNSNINKKEDKKTNIPMGEKKDRSDGVIVDKLPIPLALKEAKQPNITNIEMNRDKRDLTLTLQNDNDNKEENCRKDEKTLIEESTTLVNENNIDKNIENENIKN